jgi:hypothetical protein
MRATRRAATLALACALAACGDGGSEGPAPEVPASPEPSPATRTELAREDTTPSAFDDCPDGTEPHELSIPATDTVMRWCERVGRGGARVQHGRWEKLRGGRLVERGAYKDGVREGRWTIYWRGGPRQSQGSYQDGRRSGQWIFYREDGSEIRRIDYGSPDAGAIEVSAIPNEVEVAPAEPPPVSLRFENAGGTDLIFALEPSTEAYAMPPGASFEVLTRAPAGEIVVESTDDGLIVRPGGDAEPTLLLDGVEVELAP